MIKHYSFALIAMGLGIQAIAQPTLSTSNAVPPIGADYPISSGDAFIWAGAEGENVTFGFWNDLAETATRSYEILDPSASPNSASISGVSYLITDGGSDTTFWRQTTDALELAAEFYSGVAFFTYTDGSKELQLPLAFGDEWNDAFLGSATVSGIGVTRSGTTEGHADAHGILELPAVAYPSVLRVHVRKTSDINSLVINGTSASDHWYFYDGVVPYPVCRLMIDTLTLGGGNPQVTKRAEWFGGPGNVGQQEIDPEMVNFIAFPNPATDNVTVETGSATTVSTIEVIDHAGKIVRDIGLESFSTRGSIDVGSLSAGHYFIRITDAQGARSTRPLIIH